MVFPLTFSRDDPGLASMKLYAFATIFLLLLAGCASDPPAETQQTDSPQTGESTPAPSTPAPSTPTKQGRAHGEVERSESGVTTRPDGTRFVATKTVTVSNGAGAAEAMSFAASFASGHLRMTPGHDGYTYQMVLEVRADTEQAAREALDTVTVDHDDTLAQGTLTTSTTIGLGPQPIGLLSTPNLRVEFAAQVPTLPTDVDIDVSTADLRFDDIRGDALDITTSTGDIDGTVHYNDASISVSTGDTDLEGTLVRFVSSGSTGSIDFDGRMDSADIERSTGDISLDVTPAASGAYDIDVSTARVDIDIAGGGARGQDVAASTSTGRLEVDLIDGETVGPQDEDNVHVRTKGFSNKAIQTTVSITTSTGDVNVDN